MIAAIYARKSTDDSDRQAETRSTARQIDRATEYAPGRVGPSIRATSYAAMDAVSLRRPKV